MCERCKIEVDQRIGVFYKGNLIMVCSQCLEEIRNENIKDFEEI